MANNDRLLVQILLLVLLGASLWVLAPFWSALFWAAVLSFASWPVMRVLTRLLGGRQSLAAGLLTLVWTVLVAVPLVMLGFNLADHIKDFTELLKGFQVEGFPPAPTWLADVPLIGERLMGFWLTIDQQGSAFFATVQPYLGQVGNWLLLRSAQIGGGMLELALSLILVFFFYRDGPRLAAFCAKPVAAFDWFARRPLPGVSRRYSAARGQRGDRYCRRASHPRLDRFHHRWSAGRSGVRYFDLWF